MSKVYIQKKDGEWLNINCYSSYRGFDFLAYDIESFEVKDIDTLTLDKTTIVHGCIQAVLAALKKIGTKEPEYFIIPECLKIFCGRKIYSSNMKDIRKLKNPTFIKPLTGHKNFDGHIVNVFRDLIYTASLDNDCMVFASEVVNFISEYRFFIMYDEIIGIGHYRGDPLIFPNANIIKAALSAFKDKPRACSLDFGVTDDGRTLLIEVNDAFALGCYGLNSVKYAKMIEARWIEMNGG